MNKIQQKNENGEKMDEIVIGVKVKRSNSGSRTAVEKDRIFRLDVERIAISFFSGQYKYHFSESRGVLENSSAYDVEMTINLGKNRFVQSHAFDIKDQIERALSKRADVRTIDNKGQITIAS
jgi:hypothetical protein